MPDYPPASLSVEPEPVVVTSDAGSGAPRFARDGIVQRKGKFTLISGPFTPRESMIEDLLTVADALDAAELEYLLVRGDDNRPIIAIDRRRRKQTAAVLAAAFADEPFYVRSLDHEDDDLLVADGRLSRRKADVLRLYRPRVEPVGRLRYGADTAFQLEFWRFGDDEITAPRPNAIMRPRLPRSEAVEAEVELYGRPWRTLQQMFDPLASDIAFDIDIVFSWVDGSDAEYQRQRAARMASYVVGEGDDNEARYRQIDELKYALRSVHMFAPWIRNIYIATDSPAPPWLDPEHPSIHIMRSEDFFPDRSGLPTHNSHAVESQLHHIPGLAEHFLYSNDDMFIGRPLSPDMFFSPGGVTKFVEAGTRIGLGETDPARSGFENAARVNRRLLWERFGRVTTRHLEHCAAPLRISVLQEMEREFAEDFRRTAASPFRSATDISVTNSLYHYYGLMTGRAVTQTQAKVLYIETTLRQAPDMMRRLLKKRDQDMFCLNDGSHPEIEPAERLRIVTDFLERYFPFRAPWERPPE
ncbi:sugar phosphotransferase [Leifsonia sp. Leaf336]|uniref:stealth family protein n=1 Tax=Leifsonia sp. Leaf336 TaxID=1736341 RepID=UPI0006F242DD|nr:stealth family protein [Leifsonia sp. Leaf336]KQR50801.1 sugar phosphotransferase [Leifsonia sp. Leaf336]